MSWNELQIPLMESINQVFWTKILNISQRQVVIKVIVKKDHDKLETYFFIKCRHKNLVQSYFKKIKSCFVVRKW